MRTGGLALYGRRAECARIDTIITRVGTRSGAALLLTGEPGIGKTALLRYAHGHSAGVRVLSARGVPAEASLPFAGLHELLRPALGLLPRIPPRQAEALSAGLALSPAADVDHLAVAAGTLSLLTAAGAEKPLLVIVDDLELLDPTSREAVLFAARRAGDDVGMLLSSATGHDAALPAHPITPLDPDDGLEMLRATGRRRIAPGVAAQLVAETGGTPLALLEVIEVLTEGQLTGVEPLPDPLPAGPLVLRAFGPRLEALSAERRLALLTAAAAGDLGLAPVLAASSLLGVSPELLTDAASEEFVAVSRDRLIFRHPLLRAVVYHAAPVAQQRAVHRALAETAPSRLRPRHLGAASLAPDEAAGDELERSAAGGEPLEAQEAARLMERAADLSGTGGVQARRWVAAAELWQLAGASGRCQGLLDRAGRLTLDLRVHAHAQVVRGRSERRRGRPAQARHLLDREAARVHGTDPAGAVTLLLDAAEAGCLADDTRAALAAIHRARALGGRAPGPLPVVTTAVHASVLARCGDLTGARALLDGCRGEVERVLLGDRLPTGWRGTAWVAYPALLARLGLFGAAGALLEEAILRARQRGTTALLPGLLVERAQVSTRIGDWDGAHAAAAQAAELAGRTGQDTDLAGALVCLARLAAARGRRAECTGFLDHARRLLRPGRYDGLEPAIAAVEGLLELGAGDFETAYLRLERLAAKVEAGGAADHGRTAWAADFAEAAARLGRPGRARRLLAEAGRHAGGSAELPAILARGTALLATDPVFAEALRGGPEDPFERARTELCFAEWLRDQGRDGEAAAHSATAATVFERLAADPWTARARSVTTGCPKPRGTGEGEPMAALTDQERRVTELVGRGATNREAAQALFVSTKTVEFHLRGVYRKLGLRSRVELAVLMGRSGAAPQGGPGPAD
ncbi:LuxR family transcriptional regulator [Actinoplanes sp. NPDC051851]|uniref:helix-turn-helix transcriptional regulator n=1 Tax=Actinoplanes sp. NPDC051851 TaxID=3154753 RepID=UPI003422B6A7